MKNAHIKNRIMVILSAMILCGCGNQILETEKQAADGNGMTEDGQTEEAGLAADESRIAETAGDADESKHRLIVHWKDKYIHFKSHNIVFQPAKFIRALLNAYITFTGHLNIATLVNALCDVLSVFLIQLSKEEAMILVSLVHLSSIMLLEDENLYSSYLSLNMKMESVIIDKNEFEECIKSLVDKKILTIENGYYYIEEKIIYENRKDKL